MNKIFHQGLPDLKPIFRKGFQKIAALLLVASCLTITLIQVYDSILTLINSNKTWKEKFRAGLKGFCFAIAFICAFAARASNNLDDKYFFSFCCSACAFILLLSGKEHTGIIVILLSLPRLN